MLENEPSPCISKTTRLLRKRFYLARAHSNPLNIGCGFGGLLISLSTLFPDTLMFGMELRDKVTEYAKKQVLALRIAHPGQY
ncbi:hypothetical protein ACSBR2_015629 [Camellia fascicularis]